MMFDPDSDYRPGDYCNHCDRPKRERPPETLSVTRPAHVPHTVVKLVQRCRCGAVSILDVFRPYEAQDTLQGRLMIGAEF